MGRADINLSIKKSSGSSGIKEPEKATRVSSDERAG